MYYSDVVSDLWDSCVGDFCVYYSDVVAHCGIPVLEISVCTNCGVVADLWDSWVGDFCVLLWHSG